MYVCAQDHAIKTKVLKDPGDNPLPGACFHPSDLATVFTSMYLFGVCEGHTL